MKPDFKFKKGKIFKQTVLLCFLCIFALTINSLCFASSSSTSKVVYSGILKGTADKLNQKINETVEIPRYMKGTVESKSKMQNIFLAEDAEPIVEEQSVDFAINTVDKVVYMKVKDAKVLIDTAKNVIYFQDKSNKVYKANVNDESILYDIEEMLETFESLENQEAKLQLQMIQMVIEEVNQNLKNDYFTQEKEGDSDIYIMSLNKERFTELFNNTIESLKKNDKFIETVMTYANKYEYEEFTKGAEIIKVLDELKAEFNEDFKEIANMKFEIRIKSKDAFLKKIVGVEVTLEMEEKDSGEKINVLFSLQGENDVELAKSKEIKVKFDETENELSFNWSIEANEKEIKLNFEMPRTRYIYPEVDWNEVDYSDPDFYEKYFKPEIVIEKESVLIELKAEDDKDFKTSGKIVLKVVINEADEAMITFESNDNKAFKDAKEITVKAFENSEQLEGVLKISTKDNKTFAETSEVEAKFDEMIILAIKSDDKKKFAESSKLKLLIAQDGTMQEVLMIEAKDNKPLIESRNGHLKYEFEDEKVELGVKLENLEKFDWQRDEIYLDISTAISKMKMEIANKKIDYATESASWYGEYSESVHVEIMDKFYERDYINTGKAKLIEYDALEDMMNKAVE